jgi:hypothetical protein
MRIKLGELKRVIREVGSMSPAMSLKGDHEMHLKSALRKHGLKGDQDLLDDLMQIWNHSEPRSWMALRKSYINMYSDPSNEDERDEFDALELTAEYEGVPSPEVFVDAYKAMVRDQKRFDKRSSYEF